MLVGYHLTHQQDQSPNTYIIRWKTFKAEFKSIEVGSNLCNYEYSHTKHKLEQRICRHTLLPDTYVDIMTYQVAAYNANCSISGNWSGLVHSTVGKNFPFLAH